MKVCRHMGQFEITQNGKALSSAVLCERCTALVVAASKLHLDVMVQAQDDTGPFHPRDLQRLIYDLTGIRPKYRMPRTQQDFQRQYYLTVTKPKRAAERAAISEI